MSVYGYMDAWPGRLPGHRVAVFPIGHWSVRGIIHLIDGRALYGGRAQPVQGPGPQGLLTPMPQLAQHAT
jgi:hypothetical protein